MGPFPSVCNRQLPSSYGIKGPCFRVYVCVLLCQEKRPLVLLMFLVFLRLALRHQLHRILCRRSPEECAKPEEFCRSKKNLQTDSWNCHVPTSGEDKPFTAMRILLLSFTSSKHKLSLMTTCTSDILWLCVPVNPGELCLLASGWKNKNEATQIQRPAKTNKEWVMFKSRVCWGQLTLHVMHTSWIDKPQAYFLEMHFFQPDRIRILDSTWLSQNSYSNQNPWLHLTLPKFLLTLAHPNGVHACSFGCSRAGWLGSPLPFWVAIVGTSGQAPVSAFASVLSAFPRDWSSAFPAAEPASLLKLKKVESAAVHLSI